MTPERRPIAVLLAEDDEDDVFLTTKAFHEARLANALHCVSDGEELLDFLRCNGSHADRDHRDLPGLILLDLNMPRKSGREALREIKADPALRRIPVVVLTTSSAEEDILRCYEDGASSYIRKPVSFEGLAAAIRVLGRYWFEIVELPDGGPGRP